MNSFITIYNLSGITCSSDKDNTVFRLSKKEPLAVAICTNSPIPWNDIITKYIGKGEPKHHENFVEYAEDFESFIQDFSADKSWNMSDKEKLHIIFLGYGKYDIYPSVCNIHVKVDDQTSKLKFDEIKNNQITIDNNANLCTIGNWDRLGAILQGSTDEVKDYAKEKELEIYEMYKKRVIEKFKGTVYEDYVIECLGKFNNVKFANKILEDSQANNTKDLKIGLQTFSIEDMVTYTEKLVNANLRLNNLKDGGKGLVGSTKEIAVLTRAEGFTWIKHSLFAI